MTLRNKAPHGTQRWITLALTVVAASLLVAGAVMANLGSSPFDAADGNLVLDDETQDWVNAPNRNAGEDLPTGQQDDSFGQGTKEDTAVPTVVSGQIPNNKSDLTRFYVANDKVGGKDFLYLAWERVQEPNGTTNMDFEFNKSTSLSSNGVTPVRSEGDLLIKYDLSQGGVNPTLGYHLWVTSGIPAQVCEANNTVPCWGNGQSFGSNFEGSVNTVNGISDPIAGVSLSTRTFGEAAINLTDSGIFPAGSCSSFGRAYLKSRSSDAFTAALKDFIAPVAVNIQNCGTIVVIKDAVPDGGQDFAYTTSGTGLSSFTLEDDGNVADEPATPGTGGDWPKSITFSSIQAGSYSVAETLPVAGWSLTGLVCVDPTSNTTVNASTGVASINLAANETVTCTYTNKKDATVTIIKDAIPNNAQDFGYTASGAGLASFTLDDDGSEGNGTGGDYASSKVFTISGADFGAKTVTETLPVSGWSLTNLVCSEGTVNIATGVASFTVDPGDAITCTYTNKKDATVTIIKDAIPNNAQDFGYTASGAGLASFTLDDDGSEGNGTGGDYASSKVFTISGADFGAKTVTETLPVSGWSLTNLVCSEGTVNIATGVASFTVDPGDAITCTYTNKKDATVTIIKDAIPNNAQDFGYTASGAGLASFTLDDDGSEGNGTGGDYASSKVFTISGADFGAKTVTETLPVSGWSLTNLVCSEGTVNIATGVASFTVDPGDAITCTYTNKKDATVTIIKDAIPNNAQDFGYTASGAGLASFTLDDDGSEGNGTGGDYASSKVFTISGADFGAKTVTETLPVSGWSLTNLVCSEGTVNIATGVASFTVDPGDAITCTYTNKKDATVTIIKDAIPNNAQDFGYTASGAGLASFTLDDDGSEGNGTGGDYASSKVFTISGADFGAKTVTETLPVSGWSLTNLVCSEGTVNIATGVASFTVDPGDAITCTYTNSSLHVVIVIVCHQGTATLSPSDVTLVVGTLGGGDDIIMTSLSTAPSGFTEAQLCGLGGARFENVSHLMTRLETDISSDDSH